MHVPVFEPLSEDMVARLFTRADELLERVGLAVPDDPESLDRFAGAGARIEGDRVRFPAGLAGDIIRRSAPGRFRQRSRNPARTVTFGDGHTVLAPASGPPFVHEPGSGRRRHATLEDCRRIARMVQASDALDHAGGGWCEPGDVAADTRHLDMLHAQLTLTDKPITAFRGPGPLADSLEMIRIACGDDVLATECCLLGLFNIESPLVLPGPVARSVRMMAAAGQAAQISSYSMMGMTSPVTASVALVQMLAEVQAGAALTQIVRPGAPVICGIYAVPFSMSAMRPAFGCVESHMVLAAGAQLVRALGVPFRADGAVTSAKTVDGQAARDTAFGLWTALITRSDFALHAAGWLEAGLALSYDKFAHDVATIDLLRHQRVGMPVDLHADLEQQPLMEAPVTAAALESTWERPAIEPSVEAALDAFIRERRRIGVSPQ